MGRILAVDWGEKRIGLAVSDPLNLIAAPLDVLSRRGKTTPWPRLRKYIEEYGVGRVVVGIPRRTDGREGKRESQVREWIGEARREFPDVAWFEMDERFTTREAERLLREKGVRAVHQRSKVDQVAAALILEQFLARSKKLGPPGSSGTKQ